MREAEEVERFRLPLSKVLTLLGRVTTEAEQPGFRRVQCQFELPHSFLQVVQESLRLMLMLKADNGVSGAGEFHPRALAETDVRLSPHPAPIVRPRPCRRRQ